MNSTEPEVSALIRDVYDRELLPLWAQIQAGGPLPFPTHPDPGVRTYYRTRVKTSMEREDFEILEGSLPAAIGAGLKALWREDIPSLQNVAEQSEVIAARLRRTTEQATEVSPFIYVMF